MVYKKTKVIKKSNRILTKNQVIKEKINKIIYLTNSIRRKS